VNATSGYLKWHFESTGTAVGTFGPPTLVDETVYVCNATGILYAIDTTDGTEEWHFEIDDAGRSSATVADGTVYVGSGDSNLYAVDATSGIEQWRFGAGRAVTGSSPTVADGTVYVGSGNLRDMDLRAVDAESGTEEWRFETGDVAVPSAPTGLMGQCILPVAMATCMR
jgi:FOG: WD40-like repeat